MRKPIGLFIISALLLAAAFYHHDWYVETFTSENIIQGITTNLNREVKSIEEKSSQLVQNNLSDFEKTDSVYPFFLVDSTVVVRWTSNRFLPDLRLMQDDFHWKFYQNQRGAFLVIRKNDR
jgi:hypothetical protein